VYFVEHFNARGLHLVDLVVFALLRNCVLFHVAVMDTDLSDQRLMRSALWTDLIDLTAGRCVGLQAVTMIGRMRQELDGLSGSPYLCSLQRAGDLDQLPVTRLQQLRAQLQHDLNTLDKVSVHSSHST